MAGDTRRRINANKADKADVDSTPGEFQRRVDETLAQQATGLTQGVSARTAPGAPDAFYPGHSHSELHDMVNNGANPAAIMEVGDTWTTTGNDLVTLQSDVVTAIGSSETSWTGPAAERARQAVATLSNHAGDAGQGAQLAGTLAVRQSDAISTVRAAVPPPSPNPVTAADINARMQADPLHAGDIQAAGMRQIGAQNQAHLLAAEAVQRYDAAVVDTSATQPRFGPPPTITAPVPGPGPVGPGVTPGTPGPGGRNGGVVPPGGRGGGIGVPGVGGSRVGGVAGPLGTRPGIPSSAGTGAGTVGAATAVAGVGGFGGPSGQAGSGLGPGGAGAPGTGGGGGPGTGVGLGGLGFGEPGVGARGGGRPGSGAGREFGAERAGDARFGAGKGGGTGAGSGRSGLGGSDSERTGRRYGSGADGGARAGESERRGFGAASEDELRGTRGRAGGYGPAAGEEGAASRAAGSGRGQGLGAGGRGARGGEDEEHHSPSYLVEPDPDALFGSTDRVAPPVIG